MYQKLKSKKPMSKHTSSEKQMYPLEEKVDAVYHEKSVLIINLVFVFMLHLIVVSSKI